MDEHELQIDRLAKNVVHQAINGKRCTRAGLCRQCGAHKKVTNPQYLRCACYRIAATVYDAVRVQLKEKEIKT